MTSSLPLERQTCCMHDTTTINPSILHPSMRPSHTIRSSKLFWNRSARAIRPLSDSSQDAYRRNYTSNRRTSSQHSIYETLSLPTLQQEQKEDDDDNNSIEQDAVFDHSTKYNRRFDRLYARFLRTDIIMGVTVGYLLFALGSSPSLSLGRRLELSIPHPRGNYMANTSLRGRKPASLGIGDLTTLRSLPFRNDNDTIETEPCPFLWNWLWSQQFCKTN